jgi:MFS superfamily sulfate permease-like transporter
MGGFIYCLLGSTNHVTIGPVSILALMTGRLLLIFASSSANR